MNTKMGPFKTKSKFIEFIGGKGFVNFLSNEAIIEATQLSGLDLEGIKFKLTICDENTVNLEEIDTKVTNKKQRARLVELIEDKTVGLYRGRTVINELNFTSVQKVKDNYIPLYLSIESTTPIEILANLLESPVEASQTALSNLDDLLNSLLSDESIVDIKPESQSQSLDSGLVEVDPQLPISYLEEQFSKMKEEKLDELKKNRAKKEQELKRVEYQFSSLEKQISDLKSDINLLEDRISDIQPSEPSNGYYFFVSERQNEKVELDPKIESLIREKVSKVKSINLENFMKLFTDGEFHIKFGIKKDDNFEITQDFDSMDKEVIDRLKNLNLMIDNDKFIYKGELPWSQLVNQLIKLGFTEDAEFNKMCGSNSYQSKTENNTSTNNTF